MPALGSGYVDLLRDSSRPPRIAAVKVGNSCSETVSSVKLLYIFWMENNYFPAAKFDFFVVQFLRGRQID